MALPQADHMKIVGLHPSYVLSREIFAKIVNA